MIIIVSRRHWDDDNRWSAFRANKIPARDFVCCGCLFPSTGPRTVLLLCHVHQIAGAECDIASDLWTGGKGVES